MINNQNIAVLSEKVAALEAAIKTAGIELPKVTASDNGKTLQVVAGKWDKGIIIPELPAVTGSDNGKILQVSNGAWATGDALNFEAVTVEGETGATAGSFANIEYPSGYTASNSKIIGLEFYASDIWRTGQGVYSASSRVFALLGGTYIQVYNDDPNLLSAAVRVTLLKYNS